MHAQTRIIGQRRQAGFPAGMPRLGERIFHKGDVGLFGLFHTKLSLRNHPYVGLGEDGGELLELARIIGSQYHFSHFFVLLRRP
jgi:hypothetical protein